MSAEAGCGDQPGLLMVGSPLSQHTAFGQAVLRLLLAPSSLWLSF
jgi:hypothetical protein